MSDRPPTDPLDVALSNIERTFPPLPPWLAQRLLLPGEQVTWVRGPRLQPSWERQVTHPTFLLFAPLLGVLGLLIAWDSADPGFGIATAIVVTVGGFLTAVFVMAVACGYFTRLVVTNQRLMILQGIELVRRWSLDDLPRSLVRYRKRPDGREAPTIDLETLQTMLGGSASDQFVDAKTLRSFGKQLEQIKAREEEE